MGRSWQSGEFEPAGAGTEPDQDTAVDTDIAAVVARIVDDPVAWFSRPPVDGDGLEAKAGRNLARHVEDIADQVLTADSAGEARLSRHDAVTFVQAVTRQMSRLEALRSLALTMLTHDAAYHECDTEWASDDGEGRACPGCTNASDTEAEPAAVDSRSQYCGPVNGSPIGQVGLEVSAALGMSPTFATTLVDRAVDQVTELPETWAAMAAGVIDGHKAQIITTGTRPLILNVDPGLPPEQLAAEYARREELRSSVEARVLKDAATRTGEQVRRQVRRLVLRADPDATRYARKVAAADRRVSAPYTRGDDGGAVPGHGSMTLHGPADDLHALYQALDAAARHARNTTGDPRTLDQLRFDTVTALGWSALRSGHFGHCNTGCGCDATDGHDADGGAVSDRAAARSMPLAEHVGRSPVQIRVTVSLATLLGLDEDPADLDGVGPIPADLALDLAYSSDATWRRLVTDPLTGTLLDHGHRTYRPPTDLDAHVRARDGTCRFPTTLTSAGHADLDHTVAFDFVDVHACPGPDCDRAGGATAHHNLGALSRRAHIARTHHHWHLEQPEAGTFEWTSPAGHAYAVEADPITDPDPTLTSRADIPDDTDDLGVLITAGVAQSHVTAITSESRPPF